MRLLSGRFRVSTMKLRPALLALSGAALFIGSGAVAWADEAALDAQIGEVATGVDFTWTLMAAFLVFFIQPGFAFLARGSFAQRAPSTT